MDLLYAQPVFVPADAEIPATSAVQLEGLVREARAVGFRVKVALVYSAYDLGSITALWRKPQLYARFLGTELRPAYRGLLLVVMPNGFGMFDAGHAVAPELRTLAGLRVAAGGPALAVAALAAVQRLAAAGGHRLAVPAATAGIARPGSRSGTVAEAAFAVGALAVIGSWIVSLRLRPVRLRRRRA
jgi:hypothetical protein